jgi:hypothetical protein
LPPALVALSPAPVVFPPAPNVPSVAGAPYTGTDTPSVAEVVLLEVLLLLLLLLLLLVVVVVVVLVFEFVLSDAEDSFELKASPPHATVLLARAPSANRAARLMRTGARA